MEVTFWGVRGTVPVSGMKVNKYGGHTLCASVVSSEKEMIIIDAGTGIRKLGEFLVKKKKKNPLNIHLLLTHFHLDHIMGLPFFSPLYLPDSVITFHAPGSLEETKRYLKGLMAGRYFPLDWNGTESEKIFREIPDECFSVGGIRISHYPLNHPQGALAFSLEKDGRKVVFATDTEHPERGIDDRLAHFAQGANFFIYDATFTPEEYNSSKRGWGHSTWLEGTRLARAANVARLYLSHFNPSHSDSLIDEMISLAQKEFPLTEGAREGLKEVL